MLKHLTVVPTNFQMTERQVADRIGREYTEYEVTGISEEIENAVDSIVAINDIFWAKMNIELGRNITMTPNDPYETYEEMVEDIDNGHFAIFTGGSHPDYLGSSEQICFRQNVRARGIHDYFGHYKHGVDFTFWGEFAKWHYMKDNYPPAAQRLLFSDIAGQTGAAWYLEGGYDSPDFEQKPILAPQEWIDLCYKHCPMNLKQK